MLRPATQRARRTGAAGQKSGRNEERKDGRMAARCRAARGAFIQHRSSGKYGQGFAGRRLAGRPKRGVGMI